MSLKPSDYDTPQLQYLVANAWAHEMLLLSIFEQMPGLRAGALARIALFKDQALVSQASDVTLQMTAELATAIVEGRFPLQRNME
jgi:hypothetical protein